MKTSLLKAVALSVLLAPIAAEKCAAPKQDGLKVKVSGSVAAGFWAPFVQSKDGIDGPVDGTDVFAQNAHAAVYSSKLNFNAAGVSGSLNYGANLSVNIAASRDDDKFAATNLYLGNSMLTLTIGRQEAADKLVVNGARGVMGSSDLFYEYGLMTNGAHTKAVYTALEQHGGSALANTIDGRETQRFSTRFTLSTGRFFAREGKGGVMGVLSFTPNPYFKGIIKDDKGLGLGTDKFGENFNIALGLNAEYEFGGFRLSLDGAGAYQALPEKKDQNGATLERVFANNFEYRVDALVGFGGANLGLSWIDRMGMGMVKKTYETEGRNAGKYLMVGANYQFENVMLKPMLAVGYAHSMNKVVNKNDNTKAVDNSANHVAASVELTLASGLNAWLAGEYKFSKLPETWDLKKDNSKITDNYTKATFYVGLGAAF